MADVATAPQQPVNGTAAPEGSAEVVATENKADSTANGGSNGQANGAGGDAATTTAATNDVAKKEPEPPKDPKEDPIGWLGQQIPLAVHKVNYYILDWVQKLAVEDESKRASLPTKKGANDMITRSAFLAHLRDGQLLAQLANAFSAGSVETVHEGEAAKEKQNQTANIEAFIKFAKEKAGLSDEQVFAVADLQEKGKAGYNAVFNTLFQLGLKAQERFNQCGIDTDQLLTEVASVGPKPNLIQTIVNFLKNAGATVTSKLPLHKSASTVDNTVAAAEAATNGGETVAVNGEKTEGTNAETTTANGGANGTTPTEKVESSEPAPAAATDAAAQPKEVAAQ